MTRDRSPEAALNMALQDGMLTVFKDWAKAADRNVEARIKKEPFDFKNLMTDSKPKEKRK
jgi:hypothetical protein